jgi:hypothetical protein
MGVKLGTRREQNKYEHSTGENIWNREAVNNTKVEKIT